MFGASRKCAARSGGFSGLMSECTTLRAGADMLVSLVQSDCCVEHIAPELPPPGRMGRAAHKLRPATGAGLEGRSNNERRDYAAVALRFLTTWRLRDRKSVV